MSVFSLETRVNNPVTVKHVEEICTEMGVTVHETDKDALKILLGVFHESMEGLMELPCKYQ